MKYLLTGEETDRLDFRLLEDSDFDAWLPLFYDKNIASFLAFDPTLTPTSLCETWFEKIAHRYKNDLGGMNVLVEKASGKMVGQCGLLIQQVENEIVMEIGYSLLPDFRGKGYASEAAKKCKDFAFRNNYASFLVSIIHPDNIASQKVALQNGMKLERVLKSYKGVPAKVFRIDKKDWENKLS